MKFNLHSSLAQLFLLIFAACSFHLVECAPQSTENLDKRNVEAETCPLAVGGACAPRKNDESIVHCKGCFYNGMCEALKAGFQAKQCSKTTLKKLKKDFVCSVGNKNLRGKDCIQSVPPTTSPSTKPSFKPSMRPSLVPSQIPSGLPSLRPSMLPSTIPSHAPSKQPSASPSKRPSKPSSQPTRPCAQLNTQSELEAAIANAAKQSTAGGGVVELCNNSPIEIHSAMSYFVGFPNPVTLRCVEASSSSGDVCVIQPSANHFSHFIFLVSGKLILEGITVQNFNSQGGGGVFFLSQSTLVLKNCFFRNNFCFSSGGAIDANGNSTNPSTLDIINSSFLGNSAGMNGGVISASSNTKMDIRKSSFSGNSANSGSGGAILAGENSNIVISASSFVENSANNAGGVVLSLDRTSTNAGVILFDQSTTFSGNHAPTCNNIYFLLTQRCIE